MDFTILGNSIKTSTLPTNNYQGVEVQKMTTNWFPSKEDLVLPTRLKNIIFSLSCTVCNIFFNCAISQFMSIFCLWDTIILTNYMGKHHQTIHAILGNVFSCEMDFVDTMLHTQFNNVLHSTSHWWKSYLKYHSRLRPSRNFARKPSHFQHF